MEYNAVAVNLKFIQNYPWDHMKDEGRFKDEWGGKETEKSAMWSTLQITIIYLTYTNMTKMMWTHCVNMISFNSDSTSAK